MNATKSLAAVSGYLGANITRDDHGLRREISYPAITITRQAGARAITIANRLIERFQATATPEDSPQWSLWEREILKQVLRSSNLPEELEKYFPEEPPSYLGDTVEVIVGLHPSSVEINEKCNQMITNLCRIGHVIIVGRAGNILTRRRPNVLHVRLVGSIERRCRHVMETRKLSEKDALAYIRHEDQQRRNYARLHFNCSNIDDPCLYDITLNTDLLSDDGAARIIETALTTKVPHPIRAQAAATR